MTKSKLVPKLVPKYRRTRKTKRRRKRSWCFLGRLQVLTSAEKLACCIKRKYRRLYRTDKNLVIEVTPFYDNAGRPFYMADGGGADGKGRGCVWTTGSIYDGYQQLTRTLKKIFPLRRRGMPKRSFEYLARRNRQAWNKWHWRKKHASFEDFKAALANARFDYTDIQLSNHLGVHRSTIYHWIKGDYLPAPSTSNFVLLRLIDLGMRVDVDY